MKINPIPSRGTDREGSALVIAMVAISGLAVASMTLIQYSLAVDRERSGDTSDSSAHYLAESAIHEAATSILYGDTGNLGSEAAPVGFADGAFWTVTTDLGNDLWSIRSTALAGKGRRSLEAVVELASRGNIGAGMISKKKLKIGKDVFSDSYDSDLGTYASQAINERDGVMYAGTKGDIITDSDLEVKKGLEVFGDLHYGLKDKLKVEKGALDDLEGDILELDRELEYPAVTAPATPPSLGKLHLHGDKDSPEMDLVIGPGRVRYESVTIHNHAKVKIVGPVTIVVDKKFNLDALMDIDTTNGQVALFVGEKLEVRKKTELTVSSGSAADFITLIGSREDKKGKIKQTKVKLDAPFTGLIYAPHAKVELKKNTELFGAVIAHELKLKKDVRLHYDEALARMNSDLVGEPRLRLVSLRTVEFDAEQGSFDRRDALTVLRVGNKELTRIDQSWTISGRVENEGTVEGKWSPEDLPWVDDEDWWPDDNEESEEDWDALEKL